MANVIKKTKTLIEFKLIISFIVMHVTLKLKIQFVFASIIELIMNQMQIHFSIHSRLHK